MESQGKLGYVVNLFCINCFTSTLDCSDLKSVSFIANFLACTGHTKEQTEQRQGKDKH